MIRVISSSDLPEPVEPAMIPCTPSALAEKVSTRGSLPESNPTAVYSQSALAGSMLRFQFSRASFCSSSTEVTPSISIKVTVEARLEP